MDPDSGPREWTQRVDPDSGPRQWTHPCPVLDAADVELHGDVEAVEEVPSKHQRVFGGVDGVDPA